MRNARTRARNVARPRVTSATPGRILKRRNRNVHESIPAAVRRQTRRWLPRRAFSGIKTGPHSPGQRPATGALRIPVAAVKTHSVPRCASRNYFRPIERQIREIWKIIARNRSSRFSDASPAACRFHNENYTRRVCLRDSARGITLKVHRPARANRVKKRNVITRLFFRIVKRSFEKSGK